MEKRGSDIDLKCSCPTRWEELLWLLAKTIVGQVKKAFSLAKCGIQALESKIRGQPTFSITERHAVDFNCKRREKCRKKDEETCCYI